MATIIFDFDICNRIWHSLGPWHMTMYCMMQENIYCFTFSLSFYHFIFRMDYIIKLPLLYSVAVMNKRSGHGMRGHHFSVKKWLQRYSENYIDWRCCVSSYSK